MLSFDPSPLELSEQDLLEATTPAARQRLVVEAKGVWRRRARELHPDALPAGSSAEPFHDLTRAWEALQDWARQAPFPERPGWEVRLERAQRRMERGLGDLEWELGQRMDHLGRRLR